MDKSSWLLNEIKMRIESFGEFDLKDLKEVEIESNLEHEAYMKYLDELYAKCEELEKNLNTLIVDLNDFSNRVKEFNETF